MPLPPTNVRFVARPVRVSSFALRDFAEATSRWCGSNGCHLEPASAPTLPARDPTPGERQGAIDHFGRAVARARFQGTRRLTHVHVFTVRIAGEPKELIEVEGNLVPSSRDPYDSP